MRRKYGARWNRPGKAIAPLIHPSQITNRLDWLKSGETINIRGEAVSTAGHIVGLLTLARGGAGDPPDYSTDESPGFDPGKHLIHRAF